MGAVDEENRSDLEPFKLDEIKKVLAKEQIPRVSLLEVKGAGCHQFKIKQYRGVVYPEDSSEISVAIVVEDDEASIKLFRCS